MGEAHVGGQAAEACERMGASAYAMGNDVAFREAPDLHTAAHEAAHVVQQRAGVQLKDGVGQAGDPYERHADAVADRVVSGQPAGDLLAPFSGGKASLERKEEAVQLQVGGGGGTIGAGGGGGGTIDQYEVELKAWIPHQKVADPEEPVRIQRLLEIISSLHNTLADLFTIVSPPRLYYEYIRLYYEYNSYYRGDGHIGYPGSYRALSKASFQWDGHSISGFTHSGHYGTTHRDYDYRVWAECTVGLGPLRTTLVRINITSGSGTATATATSATSGSSTNNTFRLGLSSANPLIMIWAPTIDSILEGRINPGGIDQRYQTDLFPSHGFQVKKNGTVIRTEIVQDASRFPVLGPRGVATIGGAHEQHEHRDHPDLPAPFRANPSRAAPPGIIG